MNEFKDIPFGIATCDFKAGDWIAINLSCNHKYEYSNGIRKCLKCGKENRYYLEI